MVPRFGRSARWLGIGTAVVLTVVPGCAVLFRGTVQTVPVGSEPPGAEVFVDGERIGETPLALQLWRGRGYDVVLRLGGEERRLRLESAVDEAGGLWLLADIAPGGAVVAATLAAPRTDSLADVVLLPLIAGGAGIALVPTVVDLASGAAMQLSPTEVFVAFGSAQ